MTSTEASWAIDADVLCVQKCLLHSALLLHKINLKDSQNSLCDYICNYTSLYSWHATASHTLTRELQLFANQALSCSLMLQSLQHIKAKQRQMDMLKWSCHTASGINKPAMIRRVVDFPVPEPPMIPTASPLRMVMFAPRKMALLPNDL